MSCEQQCSSFSGLRYASCMFVCALGGIRPTRGGTIKPAAGGKTNVIVDDAFDFSDLIADLDKEMAANEGVLSRRSIEKVLDQLQKSGASAKIAELEPHVKQFMDTEAIESRKTRIRINQMLKNKGA